MATHGRGNRVIFVASLRPIDRRAIEHMKRELKTPFAAQALRIAIDLWMRQHVGAKWEEQLAEDGEAA